MASRRGSRVAASRSVALGVSFAIVAAVALGGGWLAYRSGELNRFICSGDCGPAYVVPPAGVVSASAKPMPQLANPTTSAVSAAAVRAAVAPLLGAGGLGENVGFASFDLGSGLPLWAANDTPLVPASTTKVLTMFTALSVIAPRTRFATTVRASAGKVTLVGGGDPYLLVAPPKKSPYPARADLGTLAAKTAQALKAASTTKVALSYDDSLFTGPAASPAWRSSYVPSNIVSPVSALWVDEGRVNGNIRAKAPAAHAAEVFAAAL
ncbi:MAG: dacB, partial [Nocardioidaceae bacterium]|nr:dacB [Nocardioidaceae bacterium]